METLLIEGSAKTPTIKFDAEQGIIEIKGRSIPENSIEFYKPLIDWLEKYSGKPTSCAPSCAACAIKRAAASRFSFNDAADTI